MATKKEILDELVELELEYKLLSGDMIMQDDLFEIQEKIMDLMVNLTNETGYDLPKVLPYLFRNKENP